ncbi:hypothetical protein EKG38_17490 [Shewanella canadensis]|uniref:Uncharacterized protein n=1 Tax=Shewanella canadensis TaxID=271096 RepID=A0A431WPI7_9GAMM|nr:hypothetical protein [Shewanella canadensis]RTR37532.1 hypothetical protein EKG38_17490 [Shewanella canadensis]
MFDSIWALKRILIWAGDCFGCGHALKVDRGINQLSYRHTFGYAKDETIAAGKGEPLTPFLPHTSQGGVA